MMRALPVVILLVALSACQSVPKGSGGGGVLAKVDASDAVANTDDVIAFAKTRFVDHTTGLSKLINFSAVDEGAGKTFRYVRKEVASAAGGIAAFRNDFSAFCAKGGGVYAYGVCWSGDRARFVTDILPSKRAATPTHDFVAVSVFAISGADDEGFLAEIAPLSATLKPIRFSAGKSGALGGLRKQYDDLAAQESGSLNLARLSEGERKEIARALHDALTNPEGRAGWMMVEARGGIVKAGDRYARGGENCRDVSIRRVAGKPASFIGGLSDIMTDKADTDNWTIRHTICQPASSELLGWAFRG